MRGTTRSSGRGLDRKSTRLNSSHTVISTLSLHDALSDLRRVTIGSFRRLLLRLSLPLCRLRHAWHDTKLWARLRSEEHTSELQSHRDLHSFPTRRSFRSSPRHHRFVPAAAASAEPPALPVAPCVARHEALGAASARGRRSRDGVRSRLPTP